MSLLIVANLSDRVYMCADTRLSIKTDGGLKPVHNNLLKLTYLDKAVGVGCVGSPAMGAFIINELNKNKIITNIKDVENWLKDNVGTLIDKYLTTPRKNGTNPNISDSNVVMIFMGIDSTSHKKIEAKRLIDSVKKYQDAEQKRIDGLFGEKPWSQLTPEELSRLQYEIESPGQMMLKDAVFHAMFNQKKVGEIELPILNHHVFLMEIRCDKPGEEIKFKKIEYGEVIVRGANYKDDDLVEHFFGRIDMTKKVGDPNTDLVPFIDEIYNRYSTEKGIGGSITNLLIVKNEMMSVCSTWHRQASPSSPVEFLYGTKLEGSKTYHFVDGEWVSLIPFTELLNSDEATSLVL